MKTLCPTRGALPVEVAFQRGYDFPERGGFVRLSTVLAAEGFELQQPLIEMRTFFSNAF